MLSMGEKWHTQCEEEKKTKQKRVITRKTYDVINRWHSVDDAKIHADKMALCTGHARLHKSKSNSCFVEFFGDTLAQRNDNTYFINFHLRFRHITKTKRKSKRNEETTHALLWFCFYFCKRWKRKTRTQSHSHSTTELLKNRFYLQTYRANSSLHGV